MENKSDYTKSSFTFLYYIILLSFIVVVVVVLCLRWYHMNEGASLKKLWRRQMWWFIHVSIFVAGYRFRFCYHHQQCSYYYVRLHSNQINGDAWQWCCCHLSQVIYVNIKRCQWTATSNKDCCCCCCWETNEFRHLFWQFSLFSFVTFLNFIFINNPVKASCTGLFWLNQSHHHCFFMSF